MELIVRNLYGIIFLITFFTSNVFSEDVDKSFDIRGSTVTELDADIKANSPAGSFGYTENFDARADWTTIPVGDQCDIVKVEFAHTITVHMPNWVNKASAKQCLQDNWDSTWAAVYKHELVHREILRKLETEVADRLSNIAIQPSCDAMNSAAEAEYKKIIAENKAMHDEFHKNDPPLILKGC